MSSSTVRSHAHMAGKGPRKGCNIGIIGRETSGNYMQIYRK